MLTPKFKLSQDENHVYIIVHAPYTNIRETEIDVDGENFLFVSSPYFLRLRLPGRIVENDNAKGSYICDSGDFNLTFDKENHGEHFENLDMITSLLAPRDIPDLNPTLVEMLEESGITGEEQGASCSKSDGYTTESDDDTTNYAYGFGNKVCVEFGDLAKEFPHVFELKEPDRVPIANRHELRIKYENRKFSNDHYLADFFEEELDIYINFEVFWRNENFNVESIEFTDDEISLLKDLPNKSYLLSKSEYNQVMLGLVDILYGYCYDKHTTHNETSVESTWTINKLSATLSWFCVFKEPKEVLISSYRRSLVYPIFRNFDLSRNVHDDLISLLRKGKMFIVKCLLEIYNLFNTSNQPRYILNQLYIKDYLIFVQKCRQEELDELCNNLANIDIEKKDVGFDLEEIEEAGKLVEREEALIIQNELACKLANIELIPGIKKPPYFDVTTLFNPSSSDSSSDSSSSDSSSDSLDSDDDSS
ncbi:PREDICTED: protein SHQ1 homolog [Papilio polytes]|uniref:protein SHQ1 homolog n=1 Tax=Papilio polytes TaxID=76194 RepID=UPI0006761E2C|nr:PREDICTED: protein SHQ1 homolog [Papilio polytes]